MSKTTTSQREDPLVFHKLVRLTHGKTSVGAEKGFLCVCVYRSEKQYFGNCLVLGVQDEIYVCITMWCMIEQNWCTLHRAAFISNFCHANLTFLDCVNSYCF